MDTLTWDVQRQVARSVTRAGVRPEDARQAPVVLAIFLITQLLDGSLTYWGVKQFGIELEMNALLAAFMHEVGPLPTLVAAKVMACACGMVLYVYQYLRPLAVMAGLCLGVAVVPWLFMFAWVSLHRWGA